jgi:hypothetical protein
VKRGLRAWPCARVALTVYATWMLTGALDLLTASAAAPDFHMWLTGVFPLGLVLPMGVALIASRDFILRWLRVERDDATPAAFVSAAIALLAFCAACRMVIGLVCTGVFDLANAIGSVEPKPVLNTARAHDETWGDVAVLLSCLLLVRFAPTIARLPRATRTSRASA